MTTHFNNGVTNVVKDKSPLKNAMMPDPFPVTNTQGGGYDFLGQTSFMDDFYSPLHEQIQVIMEEVHQDGI